MKNKIIISLLLIIIVFESIIPVKINAATEVKEVISVPGKIERVITEDVESEMTGLNGITGKMVQPTVAFFTFIIDAIMSIFTMVMTQTDLQAVMVDKSELNVLEDLGEASAIYPIEDMSGYKTWTGKINVKYPYFTFSSEEIFAGELEILDVNFIDDSNTDGNWLSIRKIVAQWYRVFRMIAIIGLLSVLIYIGIRIIISSMSEKSKYKEMIGHWFIAVLLAFSMEYIMAFILYSTEGLMELLKGLKGIIEVESEAGTFKTNLIGLVRFQLQHQHFTVKIGCLVMYTALVVYTFKFAFLYLKRVLNMAFLTLISPIVALTYPIDKVNDGKAKGFEMWFSEFLYNALLQPLHYILYYVLVSTSLSLAAQNPIYAIAALAFMSQAEKLLKKIFRFGKGSQETVGGLAGAFTTGAVVSTLNNMVRNPIHTLGIDNLGGNSRDESSGSSNSLSVSQFEGMDTDNLGGVIDDLNFDDFMGTDIVNGSNSTSSIPQIPGVDDFIQKYRQGISMGDLNNLKFNDNIGSMDRLMRKILNCEQQLLDPNISAHKRQQLEKDLIKYKTVFKDRLDSNESIFKNGLYPTQYFDGDSRNNNEIMQEILKLVNNASKASTPEEKDKYMKKAKGLMEKLNRRMQENKYIAQNGGINTLYEQEKQRIIKEKNDISQFFNGTVNNAGNNNNSNNANNANNNSDNTNNAARNISRADSNNEKNKKTPRPIIRGVKNVGKTIIKPVWNIEKSVGDNTLRLVGNITKTVAGVTVGVTAAAIQAGISITDGEYKPLEGVATFGAGMVGGSKLVQLGINGLSPKDIDSLNRYSKQWYNSDEIIDKYNKNYPGEGKLMRKRAVKNYVSRGITSFEDQKKAIKYAEQLKKEKGMSEDEADWIAAGTLRYRQNLVNNDNYNVIYDLEERGQYIDSKLSSYTGSESKDAIKRKHEDFIQNVLDFDRANR